MKLRRPPEHPEGGFDLTPMIDVVLLLIIFFMLTSQFARTSHRAVDLPREKGEPKAPPAPNSVVVELDASGNLSVEGRYASMREVVDDVKKTVDRAGGADALEVVVRADRSCAAAHLNKLALALAGAGVQRWKLATAGESSVSGSGSAAK